MRRKTIHPFNMVEVILAVGVIAIAIGSIMGLVPVALKSNRDAVAENCMASASDIVRTYIESLYQSNTNDFGTLGDLPSSMPNDPSSAAAVGTDLLGNSIPAKLYALSPTGTYRLEFHSGSNVDFSALVKIWRQNFTENEVLYVPRRDTVTLVNASSSTAISTSGDTVTKALFNGDTDASDIADVLQNVMVEISYPADAAAADRNTMTFSIPYAVKEL